MSGEVEILTEPENPERILIPDLAELFSRRIEEGIADVNCVAIGTIRKFNAAKQTAEIDIAYKGIFNGSLVTYPTLVDCPVFFLTGGIGAITLPVAPGDTCLVLFNDRSIDSWFVGGGTGTAPDSERMHDLADGIALVGIRSLKGVLPNFTLGGIEIRHPMITLNGNVNATTGASGTFTTADGQVITVTDGLITDIS